MAADATMNTKVQRLQGGDSLVIASGGSLEAASGSTVTLSGTVKIGSATVMPALPTADGSYKLVLSSGTATWELIV